MRPTEIIFASAFLALAGCTALDPVPNADTAIAVAKVKCGTAPAMRTHAPFDKWEAHLEDGVWQVHATDKMTYLGEIPMSEELFAAIAKDGTLQGRCGIEVHD